MSAGVELPGAEVETDPRMIKVALGVALAEDELVPCVIVGHGGQGWVDCRSDGRFVYRCTCDKIERTLTEVYIVRATGSRWRRSEDEFRLWRIRCAAKARVINLPEVSLGPLPDACAQSVRDCYVGLRLFLRCRQLTALRDEPEFIFSRRFVADWMQQTRDQAKDGIAGLLRHNVLVKTGTKILDDGHMANLYRANLNAVTPGHPVDARRPKGGRA